MTALAAPRLRTTKRCSRHRGISPSGIDATVSRPMKNVASSASSGRPSSRRRRSSSITSWIVHVAEREHDLVDAVAIVGDVTIGASGSTTGDVGDVTTDEHDRRLVEHVVVAQVGDHRRRCAARDP